MDISKYLWEIRTIRAILSAFPWFSRAVGHIQEADKRYSQINWEYESKEAAIHIAQSLLKYKPDTDSFEYPGGKERLYRAIDYNAGAADKPFIDTYSPDIRDASLINGFNQILRLVEFNCNLAYGTLSDPSAVGKDSGRDQGQQTEILFLY